jgi:hypothetical protein
VPLESIASMRLDEVVARFENVRKNGRGFMARCSAHDDRVASLSITPGQGGKTLLKCHAGCATEAIVASAGLRMSDLMGDRTAHPSQSLSPVRCDGRHEDATASYEYRNAGGDVVYVVLRFESAGGVKRFEIHRPDREGGCIRNARGVDRVPYRLPELIEAIKKPRGFAVVEGEKDADRLSSLGVIATTSAGGANWPWPESWEAHFSGAPFAVVIADSDAAGRKAARQRAQQLRSWGVKDVHVLDLFTDRNDGADVSDWLDQGHTVAELRELARNAPPAAPATDEFQLAYDIMNEPEEYREDLVAGLIPAGGLAMFVAKPKVGKTTLAYTLALAVARGEPFLERQTLKGCVLFVALEEKKQKLRDTFKRMGVASDDALYFHASRAPEDAISWLARAAKRYKPKLIIVDTLQRFVRLPDLNDYASVTNATEPVIEISRSTGAAVVFTHHANKHGTEGGDEVLGSTGLFAFVDTLVTLRRSGVRRTVWTRQRYGEDLEESVLTMDASTGLIATSGTREEADQADAETKIITYLADQTEPVDEATIRDAVEARKSVQIAALRALVNAGRVERSGGGKKNDPYRYQVCGSLVPTTYREPTEPQSETAHETREIELNSGSGDSLLDEPLGTSIDGSP